MAQREEEQSQLGSVFNEDVSENEYPISKDYSRGKYFIYDCQGQFFACVNKRGLNLCGEKRKKPIQELSFRLPCAPLKEFKELKDCHVEQMKQINLPQLYLFCFNPKIVRP